MQMNVELDTTTPIKGDGKTQPPQTERIAQAMVRAAKNIQDREEVSSEYMQSVFSQIMESTTERPQDLHHMAITGGKKVVSTKAKNRPEPHDIGLKLKCNGNDFNLRIPSQAVTLLGAITGGGKTTTMTVVAAHLLLADHDVDILTLEEDYTDIYARIYAALSAIVPQEGKGALTYAIPFDDVYDWFCDKFDNLDEKRIAHLDNIDATYGHRIRIMDAMENGHEQFTQAKTFQAYCESRRAELTDAQGNVGKLPVMLIDYAQLMRLDDNSQDYREMKGVCSILKKCAHGLGFTIIANAQINRDALKGKEHPFWAIQYYHLREAADLEHAAALILLAYADLESSRMNFRVLKIRRCKGQRIDGEIAGSVRMDMQCNFIHLNNSTEVNPARLGATHASTRTLCTAAAHEPTIARKENNGVRTTGKDASGGADRTGTAPHRKQTDKELKLNEYIK